MGNNFSKQNLKPLNAEDIAAKVASIGSAYEVYRERIIANGVNGEMISDLSEKQLTEVLKDLVILNIHIMRIVTDFKKITSQKVTFQLS